MADLAVKSDRSRRAWATRCATEEQVFVDGGFEGKMLWPKASPCPIERWVWKTLRGFERGIAKRVEVASGWRDSNDFDGVRYDRLRPGYGPAAAGMGVHIGSIGVRVVRPKPSLDVYDGVFGG